MIRWLLDRPTRAESLAYQLLVAAALCAVLAWATRTCAVPVRLEGGVEVRE